MRIVRYQRGNEISYGVLQDEIIKKLAGFPVEELLFEGEEVAIGEVKLLSPSEPRNIVAVGLNYKQHSVEFGMEQTQEPLLFAKTLSSVIGPEEKIIKPSACQNLEYEAELAVVIQKTCRNVSEACAADYVLGYTCLNDVTARDIQKRDSQWLRAKGFYTFCPFGPWIETELNPSDLKIQAVLNGNVVQDDRTSSMMFDVPFLVSYISQFMELAPGDVIATGTPGGIGGMHSGDEIKIVIEGIGELINTIE